MTELYLKCRDCLYSDSPCVPEDYKLDNNAHVEICPNYKNVFDAYVELKAENDRQRVELKERKSLENRKKKNMKTMYDWIYETLGALTKEPSEPNRKIIANVIFSEISEKYQHIEHENKALKNELLALKDKLPVWHYTKKKA